MIYINIPTLNEIQELQDSDGAYYWSGLAESLFRAHGLISICTRYNENALDIEVSSKFNSEIMLRGARLSSPELATGAPLVWEMPEKDVAAELSGQSSLEVLSVNKAILRRFNGVSVGGVFRQRVRIRREDRQIVSFEPEDTMWNNATFTVQIWPESCGDVLSWLDLGNDVKVPGIIRIDNQLVFTFPFFDVAGCWFSFPPLNARYAGIEGGRAPSSMFRYVMNLIEDHHTRFANTAIVKAKPFPEPYTSAMTVRHDYDRPITDESWGELLSFYSEKGIKASFSILPYLMPRHVLNFIEEKGHEIQLHCYAHNEYDLRYQIEGLSNRVQQPVLGVTIHGGPSGVGFRGDTHNMFFERSSLSYAEGYGVRDFTITPLARLVESVPKMTRLVAPPFHFSLDGSTRPEDHRLEQLSKDLPVQLNAGRYIVLMNHPDIHREELYTLINSMDLSTCWTVSTNDALDFARSTRLDSTVFEDSSQAMICLGSRLTESAVFQIIEGKQKKIRTVQVEAGSISIKF